MGESITEAVKAGVPVLLVLAGIGFIFVSLVNLKSVQAVNRFWLGLIGGIFLFIGITLDARESPIISPPIDPSPFDSESVTSEWSSSGEKIIFDNNANADAKSGIKEFGNANYNKAINYFEKAVASEPNNPELQIYLNNSNARDSNDDMHVLSVIVPAEQAQDDAESMLRGVADSQSKCNEEREFNIEFRIFDDANNSGRIDEISSLIVDDQEILGVVGHLTSSATKKGLETYEDNGIATISPTSTSDFLESEVFFRTTPSDVVSGAKIAEYIVKELGQATVAVFGVSGDAYSDSIKQSFRSKFEDDLGGEVRDFDLDQSNFDSQDIVESLINIDAVVLFPNTEFVSRAVSIARAIKKQYSENPLPLFGGDVLYTPQILRNGGSAVEDLVTIVPWFHSDKNQYAVDAEAKWQGQVNWITAMSFDAAQAFCKVISEDPSPTQEEILNDLKSINLPADETSGTPLYFDSSGNVEREPVLVKIVDGRKDLGVATPLGTDYGFKLVENR